MEEIPNILDVLSLALFYGFDKETRHAFRELDVIKRSFKEFDLNGYFTKGKKYLYLYNTRDLRDPISAENDLKALLRRLYDKGLSYVFVLRDNKCFLIYLDMFREQQQPDNLEPWFEASENISF